MCAAAGVLLMSMEPWAATRKAMLYFGCDTHVCCRWGATDVHGAMCFDQKVYILLWMWHSCVLPLVYCWCLWSHELLREKLNIILDVTRMCAAAGVLLMSMEPWAATRKAIHYCRCDTHVCCRWCAADVRGAMGCYEKSYILLWKWHSFGLLLVCCWWPWSHGQLREKLYTILDVTLMCAAAGVLLMSMEPFSATRKAINYCGCDNQVCCRWCAADVHGAMGCYEKS